MKKQYAPPQLVQYSLEEAPFWVRKVVEELHTDRFAQQPVRMVVSPQYTAVVDIERNYVQVSDSFCRLLGYAAEELIGQKYDYFTALKTNDIQTVFELFKKSGYMHGLWMLVHRTGSKILVRYDAWLRPDSYIESNMEVVQHLR